MILPLLIALFVEKGAENRGLKIEIHTFNLIRISSLLVAFLSGLYAMYLNYRTNTSSNIWNIIFLFFMILSLLIMYTLYSLSNFGF